MTDPTQRPHGLFIAASADGRGEQSSHPTKRRFHSRPPSRFRVAQLRHPVRTAVLTGALGAGWILTLILVMRHYGAASDLYHPAGAIPLGALLGIKRLHIDRRLLLRAGGDLETAAMVSTATVRDYVPPYNAVAQLAIDEMSSRIEQYDQRGWSVGKRTAITVAAMIGGLLVLFGLDTALGTRFITGSTFPVLLIATSNFSGREAQIDALVDRRWRLRRAVESRSAAPPPLP